MRLFGIGALASLGMTGVLAGAGTVKILESKFIRSLRSYFGVPLLALLSIPLLSAGESGLVTTYQPFNGLGSGEVVVVPVVCHCWYANGVGSAVDFIALRNVPPTDNPGQAHFDLNLASVLGLKFSTNDLGIPQAVKFIIIDATKIIEEDPAGYSREVVVRASLECLRRCLPEKLVKTPVTLRAREEDREWLAPIVAAFNDHPRDKVFYKAAP